MKRYFCGKCSGILPKGKIVCDKCGYENPELIPVLRERIKRQIIIRRIMCAAAVAALILILNANLLFPWQWRALGNKNAILNYARENYPGAKIIGQDYQTLEFVPGRSSVDSISFKWNDVEFTICTESGEYIQDNYWHGAASKKVYETFLASFFKTRSIKFDYTITASGVAAFLQDNPNSDITNFDGEETQIIIRPEFIKGTVHPRDLGWMYDFYCYCKENISLQFYKVTLIYPPSDKGAYCIHFTQDSSFTNEFDFYSAFYIFN